MNGLVVANINSSLSLVWTQTTGLVTGQVYVFYVTAINGRGESTTSISISIYAASVPSAPFNITRSNAGSTFVELIWSAPISNGGLPIIDY